MEYVAGELPVWFIVLLLAALVTAGKLIYTMFIKRLNTIESSIMQLSENQRDFVTDQEHTRDMREVREEMQRSFERIELRISQSNDHLKDRVDDIHVLLTTLIPEISKRPRN